jgi:hypothetical protein
MVLAGMLSAAMVMMGTTGCVTKAGDLFPPMANAPTWPPRPDPARIVYVGKLVTSADLKPPVNGFEAFGQAVFGKEDARSMLSPIAVCTDGGPRGERLFVADSNAQCVHVFDLGTRKYNIWRPARNQPQFAQPVAIAWDRARKRLLVSDSVGGVVLVFDAGGRCLGSLTGPGVLERPVGIAVDEPRNRIFVADAKKHRVVVLSPDGRLMQELGTRGSEPGQFNYPTHVAVDPSGLMYVSDSLNFRVQQFDSDLKFLRQIGKKGDLPGYFAQPKGIGTDSEGHLYVIDAQFENVQLYNGQGQILMDFGEEGVGPGQFWLPGGMCIVPKAGAGGRQGAPGDRIYIADTYNRRVQVFDYLPLREGNP